ncbi:hypothetical protein LINPERPRIM_LOCUS5711 [Linum perenne]
MANRLWNYEGEICISRISEGFFLIEFPSVSLCDWVLERAWHVHHSPLLLRRWFHGIAPMVLSREAIPTWVTLRNVPPQLISLKGISWISSKIGRPMSRFVRDGLSVKVCILCGAAASKPTELDLIIGTDEVKIEIEYYSCRSYAAEKDTRGAGKKIWKPTTNTPDAQQSLVMDGTASGNAVEAPVGVETAPEGAIQVPVGRVSPETPVGVEGDSLCQDGSLVGQPSLAEGGAPDGNGPKPSVQGEGSPSATVPRQVGKGTGSVTGTSLKGTAVPGSQNVHVSSGSSSSEDDSSSDGGESPKRKDVTLGEYVKVAKKVPSLSGQGVKTRRKVYRR